MSERSKSLFCLLVGVGWLANLVAGMIPPLHYESSLVVNAPMMLVLGAVFATRKGKAE